MLKYLKHFKRELTGAILEKKLFLPDLKKVKEVNK
jgi:hypothetical protein